MAKQYRVMACMVVPGTCAYKPCTKCIEMPTSDMRLAYI